MPDAVAGPLKAAIARMRDSAPLKAAIARMRDSRPLKAP
jgi:hypothetical protein